MAQEPDRDTLHAAGGSAAPIIAPPEDIFRLLVESVRDYAIFLLDPTGIISTWNSGAERLKRYRADEIIGKHFSIFYPEADVRREWPRRELELASLEGRIEDEGWRVRKDGSRFWANVIITALRDRDGTLIGFSKITRDLTERRRQEEALRHSEERFRILVEGVTDYALTLLDPEGRVSSWNVGGRRIEGYLPEEIIGRPISVFYPPEDAAAGKPARMLRMARETGRAEDDGWRVRKDGTRFWANVVITALRDESGALRGYAKVTRDMTQKRRVDDLEETGRRTNEFLAMLAHELRNPLAPIANAVTLMLMTPTGDPTLRWSREVIDRQVHHLARLVDDLLDVSRVTSGRLALQRSHVDLTSVIARSVESVRPLVDARRQILEVEEAEGAIWVDGDPIRLAQVVLNLLNNAAKYTPEGGRIRITQRVEDGDAVIRVRDSGIGIPAELLDRVFDLFTQGNRALDRSEGGLGIGLTLVRRLVTLHGGTVQATSEGAGQGSEFTIRLPTVPSAAAAASGEGAKRAAPAAEPSRQQPSAHPRRILVVDDNEDSTESMAMLLGLWGHEVRRAHDGPSALKAAAEFRPDVVLLDIGLPGMDGYDVARGLRANPDLQRVTIVGMTGYGQPEDRLRGAEAGFSHHLVKPVDPVRLRELLEAAAA